MLNSHVSVISLSVVKSVKKKHKLQTDNSATLNTFDKLILKQDFGRDKGQLWVVTSVVFSVRKGEVHSR